MGKLQKFDKINAAWIIILFHGFDETALMSAELHMCGLTLRHDNKQYIN